MAINNTLKDIREERNLIQADLAEAIGSCSQTIGRIERGERNPSLEIAIRLAHYLKVPVEDSSQMMTYKFVQCLHCNLRHLLWNPRSVNSQTVL